MYIFNESLLYIIKNSNGDFVLLMIRWSCNKTLTPCYVVVCLGCIDESYLSGQLLLDVLALSTSVTCFPAVFDQYDIILNLKLFI